MLLHGLNLVAVSKCVTTGVCDDGWLYTLQFVVKYTLICELKDRELRLLCSCYFHHLYADVADGTWEDGLCQPTF